MAKVKKSSAKGWMPQSLDEPIHNTVSLLVLLALVVVVAMIVMRLMAQ